MQDLIILNQLTTELEAVNVLIQSMGEEPFASIYPSPSPDVDKAIGALNEANRSLQARGWNWNREYAYPLTVSPDGTVSLPGNTLRCMAAYLSPIFPAGPIGQPPQQFVARGSFLYDQVNHTTQFTVAPLADLILLLPWDFLPESARRVITYTAVELYQSRDQQSQPALSVNAKTLKAAWITLEQEEDETAHWNTINGNLSVRVRLYGEGAMRRARSGI